MRTDDFETRVAKLTNQERLAAGLPALRVSPDLSHIARAKSLDMLANQTLSHFSPTYGGFTNMLSMFGIRFRATAENIAARQQTPEAVMDSWMRSPGHRGNILNPGFQEIGVGFAADGRNTYWTQIFLTR